MKEMKKDFQPRRPDRGDHWRRFRLLMAITMVAAVITVGAALLWLKAVGTPLTLHVIIATSFGVGLSVILAGVLMALIFVSARSGMDDESGKHEKDDQ